eukprot:4499381-Prymnesium_polylepis.1
MNAVFQCVCAMLALTFAPVEQQRSKGTAMSFTGERWHGRYSISVCTYLWMCLWMPLQRCTNRCPHETAHSLVRH